MTAKKRDLITKTSLRNLVRMLEGHLKDKPISDYLTHHKVVYGSYPSVKRITELIEHHYPNVDIPLVHYIHNLSGKHAPI